ncbi:unnamed protein product [Closterium sp. NIES-54]
MVTTTTPGGQRVSICTCTQTRRHLATFTRRPGSSLYTLATEPRQVTASAQVSASGQVAPSCSCRLLSHQTLLWHHRLGHPSLPRLHGMHSCLLVSGLPRSLPPLPPLPAPPYLPCVEGLQRAAPHSSSFPPTTAPLQTLHMDMWSPARVIRLQLRERFGQDLPVLSLLSDRGGEFSSDLLWDFCRGEGITLSFTLLDSPQQNGIAERRIGLVMEVARTSMIHAATPHFVWPFAVRYAAHQINLWPHVSLPETSPALRWMGKVGDASVFRVWGSRAFVRDASADKLSACAIPCDVTFDESVPFYRLLPYRSAPPLPPTLFLTPGPPPIDPLPPQGPAPSGVSCYVMLSFSFTSVDPLPGTAPVHVAVISGAAPGAASGGAASGGAACGGAEPRGAGSEGAGSRGAEPEGVEHGGAKSEGAESGGAEPWGAASSGGPAGASPRLSSQQLREWLVRHPHRRSGAPGSRWAGDTGAGGAAVPIGAVGTGGVGCAGAGDPTEPGAAGAVGAGAGVAGVGGPGAGGAGAAGAGVGGTGSGGAGAAGAGAIDPGAGGAGDTVRPRPYFDPLLQQVLGVPSTGLPPPFLCPPPDQSQPPLQPASRLPASSPYTEQSGGLTKRHEPASRHDAVDLAEDADATDNTPSDPFPNIPLTSPLHTPTFIHVHQFDPADTTREAHNYNSEACRSLDAELPPPNSSLDTLCIGNDSDDDIVKVTSFHDYDRLHYEKTNETGLRILGLVVAVRHASPKEPTTIREALCGPDSEMWKAAMAAEVAALKSRGTWKLVPRSSAKGRKILSGKWVFRIKTLADGSIDKYKARWSTTSIHLSAAKSAETLAKKFAIAPINLTTPFRTPPPNHKPDTTPFSVEDHRLYQQQLGCLLFAAVTCWPDLSYVTSQLAQYLKRPEGENLLDLRRALQYFVSTPDVGLTYEANLTATLQLHGYVDADHTRDIDNRRSHTGFIFQLQPAGLIYWNSPKQELIALLSAEDEFIAASAAVREGMYLMELLQEAKVTMNGHFTLLCYNQSSIKIVNKPGFVNRTKHIALRYFFVKDEIDKGKVKLTYCPIGDMAADLLTKKLPLQKFQHCTDLC